MYSISEIDLQPIKGTVSSDIGLYFRFRKIKLVLSARPLMIVTFFYFVVLEIFKLNIETASMKTLTNHANLTKSSSRNCVSAYCHCCKNTGGLQEAACIL
jgi:hypothetical protein